METVWPQCRGVASRGRCWLTNIQYRYTLTMKQKVLLVILCFRSLLIVASHL